MLVEEGQMSFRTALPQFLADESTAAVGFWTGAQTMRQLPPKGSFLRQAGTQGRTKAMGLQGGGEAGSGIDIQHLSASFES
jgi:hypothetical protein